MKEKMLYKNFKIGIYACTLDLEEIESACSTSINTFKTCQFKLI